jgi:hypothetical protein
MKGAAFVNIAIELLSFRVNSWCLNGLPYSSFIMSNVCFNIALYVSQRFIICGLLSRLFSFRLLFIDVLVLSLVHS